MKQTAKQRAETARSRSEAGMNQHKKPKKRKYTLDEASEFKKIEEEALYEIHGN